MDTYSLSMTRQVTASAAMTLAVLMSSLDKKKKRHHLDTKTNRQHFISLVTMKTHYSYWLKCYMRAEMTQALKTLSRPIQPSLLYEWQGQDSEDISGGRRHGSAWLALLCIKLDVGLVLLWWRRLFRGVAPVAWILRVCVPRIHPRQTENPTTIQAQCLKRCRAKIGLQIKGHICGSRT